MADRAARPRHIAPSALLSTVVVAILAWAPADAAAALPRCTISGTAAADTLRGTPKRDVICGLGGNDRILALAGNDVVIGGPGRDTIAGGAGADTLYGGAGDDTVQGDVGSDTISGDAGRDRLTGGAGDDILNGGVGNDALRGLTGADRLLGGAGNDELLGGDGDDSVAGGSGLDTVDGGSGVDALSGGGEADLLVGGSGDDLLSGDDGDDTARGGAGSDRAAGGSGRDTIDGEEDADRLAGGSGVDHVRGGPGDDKVTGGYAEVGKVWVCHWAGGPLGPAAGAGKYVAIRISTRGLEGHAAHAWDIVVIDPKSCPGRTTIDPIEDGGDDPVDDGSDDDIDGGDGTDSCSVEDGKAPSGCEDLLAPRIESVTFDKPVIDTGASDVVVTADVRMTDNLSGAAGAGPKMFFGDVWKPYISVAFVGMTGTPHDGVWRYQVTFPRYIPAGDYDFRILSVDEDHNYGFHPSRRAPGVATIIRQVDPGDVTAPVVTNLQQSHASVDTSAASRTVAFEADFSDDVSGLRMFGAKLVMPGETLGSNVGGYISTGDPMAGTAKFSITLPRYSRTGTYTVSLLVEDRAGNVRAVGTRTIEQVGAGDVTGPTLSELTISPTTINTTLADQVVTIRVRIVDDMSGFRTGSIQLVSPDVQQRHTTSFSSLVRISGTALDGIYETQVTIPRYSDLGQWSYNTGGADEASNRSVTLTGPAFFNAG